MGEKNSVTTGSTTVVALSLSTWGSPEGAISAGCQGAALTFVDPTPSDGYDVSTRTSWFRTSITFDGPTTLSVSVNCSDGDPSFAIG